MVSGSLRDGELAATVTLIDKAWPVSFFHNLDCATAEGLASRLPSDP